jgi:putative transposase
MPRKRFITEMIINKTREAEVFFSQGRTAAEACCASNVSEQTYYRWRKEYGGMGTDQAHRLKELEKENVFVYIEARHFCTPSQRQQGIPNGSINPEDSVYDKSKREQSSTSQKGYQGSGQGPVWIAQIEAGP